MQAKRPPSPPLDPGGAETDLDPRRFPLDADKLDKIGTYLRVLSEVTIDKPSAARLTQNCGINQEMPRLEARLSDAHPEGAPF